MGQPHDELEQVRVWWRRPYSRGFKESVGPRHRPLQQVSYYRFERFVFTVLLYSL